MTQKLLTEEKVPVRRILLGLEPILAVCDSLSFDCAKVWNGDFSID